MKRIMRIAVAIAIGVSSLATGLEAGPKKKAAEPAPARRAAAPVATPPVTTTPSIAPLAPAPASADSSFVPRRGEVPASPNAPMPERPMEPDIQGAYTYSNGTGSFEARVQRLREDLYSITSTEGWRGVGIFDGSVYRGVFRRMGADPRIGSITGDHSIDWSVTDRPTVRVVQDGASSEERQSWTRSVVVTNDAPAFGEYVYVEELPEAIEKPGPVYPDEARRAGVDGTVMVQALVLKDGTVGDTRIVKSIPALDAAAVASVRQWRFKPALSKGAPVAVWVAVPVKFTLH